VPDIHGNGAPSRSKGDPSYQRPLFNRRARRNPLVTKAISGHTAEKSVE
jgi:hypothetical protein